MWKLLAGYVIRKKIISKIEFVCKLVGNKLSMKEMPV